MVTSVMRSKTDQKSQNSLCSLYFWDETNVFDYHLNTRIDNIHGESIYGIVHIQRKTENPEGFQIKQIIFIKFVKKKNLQLMEAIKSLNYGEE